MQKRINPWLYILFLLFVTVAYRVTGQPILCKYDTVHLCQGTNKVAITLTVKNAFGVTAISLKSHFDQTSLTYLATSYQNPKLSIGSVTVFGFGQGKINIGWFSLVPQNFSDDTLFQFLFTCNSDISPFIFDTLPPGECEWAGTAIPPAYPPVLPSHYQNGQVDHHKVKVYAGSDTAIAPGTSATLLAVASSGIPPYSFLWNNGVSIDTNIVTPSVSSSYIVSVTDATACFSTDTVMVNILPGYGSLSGSFSYLNSLSTTLSGIIVRAVKAGITEGTDTTDSQGNFAFSNLAPGTYQLLAQTNKTWGGVNAVDALLTLKHFTNMIPLTGLKLKAGDVNASGFVNTVDGLLIARRFVNLITSFPSGNWVFEKDSVVICGNSPVINVKGLCYGDVNGSYVPGTKEGNLPRLLLKGAINQINSSALEIPVFSDQVAEISSMSVVIDFPTDKIQIRSVKVKSPGNLVFNVQGNQLRMAWYSLEPLKLQAGDTLFIVFAVADSKNEKLNCDFSFQAGTVFSDFEGNPVPDLELSYPEVIFNIKNPWMGQNLPNPFTNQTKIPFYLPEAAEVRLLVKDIAGREIIKTSAMEFPGGNQSMLLHTESLKPGVYLYQLDIQTRDKPQQIVKKMIVN